MPGSESNSGAGLLQRGVTLAVCIPVWNNRRSRVLQGERVKKSGRLQMYGIARSLAALGFASICIAFPASAQETVRIRGTIERIDGPVYVVKNRDGSEVRLTVTDNPLYVAIVPATMADIKAGMFVGSAGMMEADGTQKAIEVHIFPESMRGTGEGHYDWDLKPQSKMTNANVEQT